MYCKTSFRVNNR